MSQMQLAHGEEWVVATLPLRMRVPGEVRTGHNRTAQPDAAGLDVLPFVNPSVPTLVLETEGSKVRS